MTTRTVLVSGASIAGPSIAHWLSRTGWDVTVVERAPGIRPGGQAVDFRGEVHRTVLSRMGVTDAIEARQTGKTDWRVVDADDRTLATVPGEFLGGDVEILRGDLSDVLAASTRSTCEYLFDDTVTSLVDTPVGVEVAFEKAGSRRFDLVIGADGIHSAVRRLAVGPEAGLVEDLGYRYAVAGSTTATAPRPPGVRPERGVAAMYGEPGRTVLEGSTKAPALFVFRSDGSTWDRRDPETQKAVVARVFAGMGWRTSEVLEQALGAEDFFLDEMARVTMRRWTTGRVALVGDAGYGNTLGGFGTGLALVGAYVLAGELAAAGGDHRTAFGRYDELMRGYTRGTRSNGAGPFMAPPSAWRMRLRNLTWTLPPLTRTALWVGEHLASRIDLPDYPGLPTSTPVRSMS